MKCSISRRVIDEAEDPASLPYAAASHLEGCASCRQFADERGRLRKLLLEPVRVSAPANFEAMVARRLSQRAAQRRPFWFGGGFYVTAGAAATALACMILAVQLSRSNRLAPPPGSTGGVVAESQLLTPTPKPNEGVIGPVSPGRGGLRNYIPRKTVYRPHPEKTGDLAGVATPVATVSGITDITAQTRALLLVRNSGSERQILVPMVSVGAQPWLSVSLPAGEERGVRTSF